MKRLTLIPTAGLLLFSCSGTQSFDSDEDAPARSPNSDEQHLDEPDSGAVPASTPEDSINAGADEPLVIDNPQEQDRVQAHADQTIKVLLYTFGPGKYLEPTLDGSSVQFLRLAPTERQAPGGVSQELFLKCQNVGQSLVTVRHSETEPDRTISFTIECGGEE